jgi:hypothetical protein
MGFNSVFEGLNKTLYDCDAAVLLNVCIYLVFLGEGWLALVPSHLPHLRRLDMLGCGNVCDKYVEEHVAAVPELEVTKSLKLLWEL